MEPKTLQNLTTELESMFGSLKGRRLNAILAETRTTIHDNHQPGNIIQMGRGRYLVGKHGEYRKVE